MKCIKVPLWAEKIQIRRTGADTVEVTGENHYLFPDGNSISRPGRENCWMHIEFSNSETESELLNFLKTHGPVNGEKPTGRLFSPSISHSGFESILVEQSINKARTAQQAIAAAVRLVATLQSEKAPSPETLSRLSSRLAEYLGSEMEAWSQSGSWSARTL